MPRLRAWVPGVGMRVVSTFAGAGGSSTGYKMAGCEVVAAVEWDKHAVQCYRANHPAARVFHRDIATVSGEELLHATGLQRGELDLLDGSPPCQGFSDSGSRILDDPRNQLFREHLRLVDELNPKHVVIENVAGMIRGKMKHVAAEIVSELQSRGYAVAAGLLEANYFGVPQRRPRVFFIASRVGKPSLPRPTVRRSVTAGKALRHVGPGLVREVTSPRLMQFNRVTKPGEGGREFCDRIGREKHSYFSWFKLHPRRVSPTLVKTPGTQFHWEDRLIGLNEARVLTGFPLDYKLPPLDGDSPADEYRRGWNRIGNAVAPPVSCEIARQSLRPLSEMCGD